MSNTLDQLAKHFRGDILREASDLQRYATDESMFFMSPLLIARPRDAADVGAALAWARQHQISITARGAGTSTAGQAIGNGLILDFSQHMKTLLAVDQTEKTARVQPGLVYDDLNRQLKAHQLFFPVNPSSGHRCTLGGMVANNASGPFSLKYGAMKDNVLGLEVVLADGRTIDTARPPPELLSALTTLLAPYRQTIQRCTPATRVNSSGYNLAAALAGDAVNVTQLFLASEGTLGLVTEAHLRLSALPAHTATAVLGFRNLDDCGKAVLELVQLQPMALEIIDEELLGVMRQHRELAREIFPAGLEAAIFLQFDSNGCDVEQSLKTARERVGSVTAKFSLHPDEEALWALRREASPLLHKTFKTQKPLRFIEDGAVTPERLPEFWRGLKAILRKHQIGGATFGHAGNGHLHINPRLDPLDPADQQKIRAIYAEQTDLVLRLGGTISGEHGDGILRTAAVRRQYPELMEVFDRLKNFFDPQGIFNPGKILDADPERPFRGWRYRA